MYCFPYFFNFRLFKVFSSFFVNTFFLLKVFISLFSVVVKLSNSSNIFFVSVLSNNLSKSFGNIAILFFFLNGNLLSVINLNIFWSNISFSSNFFNDSFPFNTSDGDSFPFNASDGASSPFNASIGVVLL